MLERRLGWIAVVIAALGCEAAEPTAAGSEQRKPKPAAKQAEAPAKAPEPGDEAIPITLPEKSPRGDGADARGNVGTDEPSMSESFGPGTSLADCLSNCATRSLSDDNRATCRLLCQSHYARADKPDRGGLIDAYVGCFDACDGESSCRKRCSSDVGRDDACASKCLDTFGQCLAPCEGGSEAGRCTERCETTARSCTSSC